MTRLSERRVALIERGELPAAEAGTSRLSRRRRAMEERGELGTSEPRPTRLQRRAKSLREKPLPPKLEKLHKRIRWVAETAAKYDLSDLEASEVLRQKWTPEKLVKTTRVPRAPMAFAIPAAITPETERGRIVESLQRGVLERQEAARKAKRTVPVEEVPFWGMLKTRYQRGRGVVDIGRAGYAGQMGELSREEVLGRADAAEKRLESLPKDIPQWEWADLGSLRGWEAASKDVIGATVELLPYIEASVQRGVEYGMAGAVGAGAAAALAGQVPPLTVLPEEAITVPVVAALGFKVGFITGVAENAMQVEGGSAYVAMLRTGVDERIARPFSIGIGLGNAALEFGQISVLIKSFGGAALFKQKLREVATKNPTVRRAFIDAGLVFLKGSATEIGQEMAQETNSAVGEAMAAAIDAMLKEKEYEGPTKFAVAQRLKETFIQSAKGFPLLMLPGAAKQAAVGGIRAQMIARATNAPVDAVHAAREAVRASAAEGGSAQEQIGAGAATLQREAQARGIEVDREQAEAAAGQIVRGEQAVAEPAREAPPPGEARAADVRPAPAPADVQTNPTKQGQDLLTDDEGALRFRRERDVSDSVRESVAADPAAQKVQAENDAAREAVHERQKGRARRLLRAVKQKLIDVSGNLKRALLATGHEDAKRALRRHDLIFGANAHAVVLIEADLAEIFAGLTTHEQETVADYLQAIRVIEVDEYARSRAAQRTFEKPAAQEAVERRTAELTEGPLLAGQIPVTTPGDVESNLLWIMQHPGGMGAAESQAWLDAARNAPGFDKIEAAARRYWEAHHRNLQRMRDGGLIGDEAYEYLRTHHRHYHPRLFIQYLDPPGVQTVTTGFRKRITISDSGLKALDEGSTEHLVNEPGYLLAEAVARTEARIAKNRANLSMLAFARDAPENVVGIREAEVVGENPDGSPRYQDAPRGSEAIDVMENGIRRRMFMPREMAAEWVTQSPEITRSLTRFLRWVSGGQIVRAFATGYNPAFAFTNIPRDIGLIWFASDWLSKETGVQLYSRHAPFAAIQMTADMLRVGKDVIARSGRVNDALEQGLGMDFMTHEGMLFRKPAQMRGRVEQARGRLSQELSRAGKALAWIGETSELLSRMMLRERALKNGADAETATWIARAYLDFSQGGSWMKMADSLIPYLNAAVQGTRSGFKAMAARPGNFTYKVAQLGSACAGLTLLALLFARDMWDRIPDNIKDRYFIIPLPPWLSFWKDAQDNDRWDYLAISKPEVVRPFTTVFENIAEWSVTGTMPKRAWAGGLDDVFDIVPLGKLPPIMAAWLAYVGNYDAWRKEYVWKGDERDPEFEVDVTVHPFFESLGKATGLSPKRLQRAMGTLCPPYNPAVAATAYGARSLLDKMSDEQKAEARKQFLRGVSGIGRIIRSTPPRIVHEEIREARIAENTRRAKQNIELRKRYRRGEDLRTITRDFIRTQPREDKKRLYNRTKLMFQRRGISDWWLNLAELPSPEVKARMYADKWLLASKEERREMMRLLIRTPGIRSERFNRAFLQFKNLAADMKPETAARPTRLQRRAKLYRKKGGQNR